MVWTWVMGFWHKGSQMGLLIINLERKDSNGAIWPFGCSYTPPSLRYYEEPQEPWLHKGADIYIKGEWKLRNLGKKNNYFILWNFTLECVSAVIRLKTLRTRWNGKVYIGMSHLSILMDLLEHVWVGSWVVAFLSCSRVNI